MGFEKQLGHITSKAELLRWIEENYTEGSQGVILLQTEDDEGHWTVKYYDIGGITLERVVYLITSFGHWLHATSGYGD